MENSSNEDTSRTRNINGNRHLEIMKGVVKAIYNPLSDNGNKNKDTRAKVANAKVAMFQDLRNNKHGAMDVDDNTIVVDHPADNPSGRFAPTGYGHDCLLPLDRIQRKSRVHKVEDNSFRPKAPRGISTLDSLYHILIFGKAM